MQNNFAKFENSELRKSDRLKIFHEDSYQQKSAPLQCLKCNYLASRISFLKRHILNHHYPQTSLPFDKAIKDSLDKAIKSEPTLVDDTGGTPVLPKKVDPMDYSPSTHMTKLAIKCEVASPFEEESSLYPDWPGWPAEEEERPLEDSSFPVQVQSQKKSEAAFPLKMPKLLVDCSDWPVGGKSLNKEIFCEDTPVSLEQVRPHIRHELKSSACKEESFYGDWPGLPTEEEDERLLEESSFPMQTKINIEPEPASLFEEENCFPGWPGWQVEDEDENHFEESSLPAKVVKKAKIQDQFPLLLGKEVFNCPHCPKSYYHLNSVYRHIGSAHPVKKETSTRNNEVKQ